MYLVHFGRSPAAATAAAAATVPVPQARRRAVPSIGTEASESCNLPRALTLGAAAAAAVVAAACCCLSCFSYFQITNFKIQFSNLQFIAAQVKQTEFCSQFIIYEFILNPYTEFHFVSLVSACRASVSRCSHHTLFSPLLSSLSLFLVSLFRCSLLSRLSLSLAEQLLSQCRAQPAPVIIPQGAVDLLQAYQRNTRFTEILIISQTCPCRVREPERVGER